MPEWLSADWFLIGNLRAFSWENPIFLYLIPGIPVLFLLRWLFYNRKNQKLGLSIDKEMTEEANLGFLRFLVPLIFAMGLSFLLIAMARPQKALQNEEVITEGINIVLALDISESMLATDLKPNRIEAAKRVAGQFIDRRKSDKIGLVVFAGETMTLCPLTVDYKLVKNYLTQVSPELISTSGTAIGNALATSINRLRDIPGFSKIIVLLSDGDNTAGDLDPITSAHLALSFGIRIYTIAVGQNTDKEIIDEKTLRLIAKEGKGRFYKAGNTQTLENIFRQIDDLETSRFKRNEIKEMRDYYYVYLNWSVVFILLSFVLKNTFLGNFLED